MEQNSAAGEKFVTDWRKDHDFDLFQMNNYIMLKMLAAAINKAKSTDPLKVALALEGATMKGILGHEYTMRAADHQLLEPLYVPEFTKGVKYDLKRRALAGRPTRWWVEHRLVDVMVFLVSLCDVSHHNGEHCPFRIESVVEFELRNTG